VPPFLLRCGVSLGNLTDAKNAIAAAAAAASGKSKPFAPANTEATMVVSAPAGVMSPAAAKKDGSPSGSPEEKRKNGHKLSAFEIALQVCGKMSACLFSRDGASALTLSHELSLFVYVLLRRPRRHRSGAPLPPRHRPFCLPQPRRPRRDPRSERHLLPRAPPDDTLSH